MDCYCEKSDKQAGTNLNFYNIVYTAYDQRLCEHIYTFQEGSNILRSFKDIETLTAFLNHRLTMTITLAITTLIIME